MITNKELQEALSKYDDELPVAIAINYNNHISLFYQIAIAGIKSEDMKLVIINNPDVDEEYEMLLNGAENVEENYS